MQKAMDGCCGSKDEYICMMEEYSGGGQYTHLQLLYYFSIRDIFWKISEESLTFKRMHNTSKLSISFIMSFQYPAKLKCTRITNGKYFHLSNLPASTILSISNTAGTDSTAWRYWLHYENHLIQFRNIMAQHGFLAGKAT